MQLIDYFDKGVEVDPDRAFLIDDAGRRSHRDVQRESCRIANALAHTGIAAGTKVAVYSGNAACAFECVIGLLRRGCVWVPVNTRNHIDDTIFVLNNTDTEILVFSAVFREQACAILAQCPGIRLAICLERADPPYQSLADFIAGASDNPIDNDVAMDDVATLFSSGGTTGRPKGVMMTHRAWEAMILGYRSLIGHSHPVHLVAAPLTHAAGGLALTMMWMGTTNVILPGFDALRVMQAIEAQRVTHLFLPPTAIYRLLAHPDVRRYNYTSLRYFSYTAAPMAPERIREAMDVFGPVMMTSLGQTEIGVYGTWFPPEAHARALAEGNTRRFLSCGRAAPFVRVGIMDDDGKLLPPETAGEIVIRSSTVMTGYYRNPEETARISTHGWHHTGDIGVMDVDGWVYLRDRKRDMIITGGFNVFPSEVEKAILAHPAVQDCAVIGVPHADWGEAVTAVVELKPDNEVGSEAILAFCRARLSALQVPKTIVIWPELPRSPVGKILRREVRDTFWAGRERAI